MAGGTGLNLTRANRVYLMDSWWNAAAEDQAMDRVHRIGQTRPVEVVRYLCANTVEEKILEIQERKRALSEQALLRRENASGGARLRDLKQIFGE
jgi:SNF2 family DNA or RNA helicase